MSTIGKVLVVLVTVLVLVWIVLVSGVTELNKNSAKAIDAEKKQAAIVEDGIPVERRRATQNRDEANNQRAATGREEVSLRARQVRLERDRSRALDRTSRLKFQLERSETTEKTAKLDSDTRLKERDDMKKALADEEKVVKKAQAENEELMTALGELRDKFQKIFQENQEKLRERAKNISQ